MCWEAIAILKGDFAGDDRCGRKQAHDGERCDRFAGAGFPDQSKNFAGGDGERKTANGGHRCSRPRRLAGRECPASTGSRELDSQVADVEQRAHEGYGISGDSTFSVATPAAPIPPRGNTPLTARSVLPSARSGPTPYPTRASADWRRDRRPNHSSPYRPSA